MSDYVSWNVKLDDGTEEEVEMGENGLVLDGSLHVETLGCCIGIAIYIILRKVKGIFHTWILCLGIVKTI